MSVYFVYAKEVNRLKIGYTGSGNMERRFNVMKTNSPVPLRISAFVPDLGEEYETVLHEKFAEYRVFGEWFDYEWPLRSFVDKLKVLHGLPGEVPNARKINNVIRPSAQEFFDHASILGGRSVIELAYPLEYLGNHDGLGELLDFGLVQEDWNVVSRHQDCLIAWSGTSTLSQLVSQLSGCLPETRVSILGMGIS